MGSEKKNLPKKRTTSTVFVKGVLEDEKISNFTIQMAHFPPVGIGEKSSGFFRSNRFLVTGEKWEEKNLPVL